MADNILTIKSNTKKLLKMGAAELMDKVHFFREAEKVEPSAYQNNPEGFKAGDTVSIKIPPNYTVQEDNFDITGAIGDSKEQAVDMVLDMSGTISFDLDTAQLAHDIDVKSVYERMVQPAIYDLAANLEKRFLEKATQYTGNLVGSAGATLVDPDTVMHGGELLDEFLCPEGMRKFLMDSAAMRNAVNENKNLFTFNREERRKAALGEAYGFDWLKSQLIYRHTNGNDVSGVAVENSVFTIANGMSSLGIDGLTATTGTLTKGTVFTIADVYAVHPQTKVTLPFLKQFSHVGDDLTANGSGQATITLNEAIYDNTDARQNVSALPADEAAITIVGSASTTYKHSLQFHKKAFRVLSVGLAMPEKAELAEQVSEQGINLALIKDFDIKERKWVTRLDYLGGVVAVRPTHACRVTN